MKFEDKKDGKTEESENRAQAEIVESYITVLISGGNNDPATLIIRKYQYGDAVAKFVNLCDGMKISILYVDECNFTFATIETSHIDDTNLSGSS